MKRVLYRYLSGLWAIILCFSSFSVQANASTATPGIQYAPQISSANYEYGKPYLYATPFTARSYWEGNLVSDTVMVYNLINTAKLTGTGVGPYASIGAYRFHAMGNPQRGTAYRHRNLEDCGLSRSTAGKIRAIVMNAFPYLSDIRVIENNVNNWLKKQGLPQVQNLQTGEVILAAQCIIWKLIHDDAYVISSLYSGVRKMQGDSLWNASVVFPEIMEQRPTNQTPSNLESLYQFYFHVAAAKPLCTLLGEHSFQNMVYSEKQNPDGSCMVSVDFTLDASLGMNDVLNLTAVCGAQKITQPIGTQKVYHVQFDSVPAGEPVDLQITGYQYCEDVYLFMPENETSMENALLGFDSSCLPVDARATVTKA